MSSAVIGQESKNLLPPVEYAQADKPNPALAPAPAAPPAAPAPAKKPSVSWWTDFSASPYLAWRHPDLSGKPIFGAGIGFGYQINKLVGVHFLNTIYDEPDTLGHDKFGKPAVAEEKGWLSGTGVDESEILGRADLIEGVGKGKDRFVGFLLASVTHSWQHDDDAIGVGAGFDIRLAKNFALEMSYRVRSFFDQGDDGIGTAGLHFQW